MRTRRRPDASCAGSRELSLPSKPSGPGEIDPPIKSLIWHSLTKLDQTVGTVAYMSPEQAQGMEVDHRTDIWALGCVLYEMVSGQRPFPGVHDQALLYEICNQDPEPLTGVRTGVPMELEFVVGKCLAKDAADRYQHANEIAVDLRTLSEKLKSGRSTIVTRAGELSRSVRPRTVSRPSTGVASSSTSMGTVRPLQGALAMALLAVCALAYLAWKGDSEPRSQSSLVRFSIPANILRGSNPTLSPDGRYVVYQIVEGETTALKLHDLRSAQSHVLGESARFNNRYWCPAWSPDSQWVAFAERSQTIKKISVEGGRATTLAESPELAGNCNGSAWSPSGDKFMFSTGFAPGFRLFQVRANGGPVEPIEGSDGEAVVGVYPSYLPIEGKEIIIASNVGVDSSFLFDAMSGEHIGEVEGYAVRYSEGHLLSSASYDDRSIWAQPFSLASLEPTGDRFRVAEIGSRVSVSNSGAITYGEWIRSDEQFVLYDRAGRQIKFIGQPQRILRLPSFSPDEKQVLGTTLGGDIWTHDVDRPVATRLTFHEAADTWAVWSPSGRWISFSSDRDGLREPFRLSPGNDEEPTQLLEEDWAGFVFDWSQDERTLLAGGPRSQSLASLAVDHDLMVLRQIGESGRYEKTPLLQTEFDEKGAQLSPDGRFFAYTSDESGQFEVYVQRFPETGEKRRASLRGGHGARWRDDGKELYYVEDDALMAVPVTYSPTQSFGQPVELFRSRALRYSLSRVFPYDVTRDGQFFVVAEPVDQGPTESIWVVLNWYDEFRDREQVNQ